MTDSPSDRATRLLAAARRGTEPSAADEARVRSRLHARALAAPLLLSTKTAHALVTGSKLSAGKLLVALSICGGTAALGAVAVQQSRARTIVPAVGAGAVRPQNPAVLGAPRAVEPSASTALVSPPAPVVESAPAFDPVHDDGARVLSPAAKRVAASANAAAPSSSAAAPVSAEDLSLEIAGLRRAQHLLHGGNANAALAALDEVARDVPKGALGEERDATRALALCQLGRASDPRVTAFFARYPGSVHAARVQKACSRGSFE